MPRRRLLQSLAALFLVYTTSVIRPSASSERQQSPQPPPAHPIAPIPAILDAFRSHALITLPSAHGNEQIHAFELALIRAPQFAATVNDIVVEFGNAKYQDVIDRFMAGDDVPSASLRQVWQNTTVAFSTWDSPVTEEFFQAVRAVNMSLPRNHRLRVLLGDPPIDWDTVHTAEDYRPWPQRRDTDPANLIQQEVLAKHRRALVLYGQMHAQRKDLLANFEPSGGLFGLERASTIRVFSVWAAIDADLQQIQPDVAHWPNPSFALLRATQLGAADFTAYYPTETPRFDTRNGGGALVPRDQWRTMRMEDQFDALLYVGPLSALTTSRLSPTLCADSGYITMRLSRMAIAGAPQSEGDKLKRYCASVTQLIRRDEDGLLAGELSQGESDPRR